MYYVHETKKDFDEGKYYMKTYVEEDARDNAKILQDQGTSPIISNDKGEVILDSKLS